MEEGVVEAVEDDRLEDFLSSTPRLLYAAGADFQMGPVI